MTVSIDTLVSSMKQHNIDVETMQREYREARLKRNEYSKLGNAEMAAEWQQLFLECQKWLIDQGEV